MGGPRRLAHLRVWFGSVPPEQICAVTDSVSEQQRSVRSISIIILDMTEHLRDWVMERSCLSKVDFLSSGEMTDSLRMNETGGAEYATRPTGPTLSSECGGYVARIDSCCSICSCHLFCIPADPAYRFCMVSSHVHILPVSCWTEYP